MSSGIPNGWTDDMSVAIGNDRPVSELVEFILLSLLAQQEPSDILGAITRSFEMSDDDAELALDRAQGGIVRALTGNEANRPDQTKDPVAFFAFETVWATFPRVHWFSRRRKPRGKWLEWDESRR